MEAYLGSGLLNEAILYLELQSRALLTQHKFKDAVVLVERIAGLESDASESTVLELIRDRLKDFIVVLATEVILMAVSYSEPLLKHHRLLENTYRAPPKKKAK